MRLLKVVKQGRLVTYANIFLTMKINSECIIQCNSTVYISDQEGLNIPDQKYAVTFRLDINQ